MIVCPCRDCPADFVSDCWVNSVSDLLSMLCFGQHYACVCASEGHVCPIPVAIACSSHSVSRTRFLAVRGELITTSTRRGKFTVYAGLLLLFIWGTVPREAKRRTAQRWTVNSSYVHECVCEREKDVWYQLTQQIWICVYLKYSRWTGIVCIKVFMLHYHCSYPWSRFRQLE